MSLVPPEALPHRADREALESEMSEVKEICVKGIM
jgi:hypothetical protein